MTNSSVLPALPAAVTQSDAAKIAAEVAAKYMPQTSTAWFDPLHNWTQFLVACVLLSLLALIICYWRTLMDWISEDNILRCDRFFLQYWLFLQCCGLCDGEWTRCLSTFCCCCCSDFRGRNLKRMLGEWLGLSPVAVKVQNLMLGGLPRNRDGWFTRKSPDIYIQIQPDELQPTLNTEVITQANIDCVQFTSGFTLLVKNNIKEDPVRICVREMRMVGSRDIADCYICPTRLIAWAHKKQKVRVQLSPLPGHADSLRTPWVLLDLSIPGEMKFLRSATGTFNPIVMETKTNNEGSDRSVLEPSMLEHRFADAENPGCAGSFGLCTSHRPQPDSLVLLPVQSSSDYRMYNKFDEFVDRYPLLNEKGLQVTESEDMLGRESMRFRGYVRTSLFFLVLFIIVYAVGRFYTMTCYQEYRQWLAVKTMSENEEEEFATYGPWYDKVLDRCAFAHVDAYKLVSNVWAKFIKTTRKECNPPMEEVVNFCSHHSKYTNETPQVFQMIDCLPVICTLDDNLHDWDRTVLIVILFWLTMACIGRACVDNRMRQVLERPSVETITQVFEYLKEGRRSSRTVAPEEQTQLIRNNNRRPVAFGGAMG